METGEATKYNPKIYFDNGRQLVWGKNLTKEQLGSMEKGEIFILMGKNGEPFSEVLKDSYGQTREHFLVSTRQNECPECNG